MLTNLFLRCVPQAGTPIERAGHLQVGMALLGNAFELPCPLALLPCELAAGQDLLRPLQLWLLLQRGVGLYVGAIHRVGMYSGATWRWHGPGGRPEQTFGCDTV